MRKAALQLRDDDRHHRSLGSGLRLNQLPPMPAASAAEYRRHLDAIAKRLEALGAVKTDRADDLDRRAKHVEQALRATYLSPRGQTALRIKAGMLAYARKHHLKVPKGFNLRYDHMGAAARQLLGLIQQSMHRPPTGLLDHATRVELRPFMPKPGFASLAYPGDDATTQQKACWLAANASHMGAPPELLVMCALVESGPSLINQPGGDRDSVGFFQIRANMHPVPAGFGAASGQIRPKSWWAEHPEAQIAWVRGAVRSARSGHSDRGADTTGATALGNWCADIERPAEQYRGRYAQQYDEARRLVRNCRAAAAPVAAAASTGAAGVAAGLDPAARRTLDAARTQLGVEEQGGNNRGSRVELYQHSAGVGAGEPWCASFVTWVLKHSGHALGRGNWASVGFWVGEARAHRGMHVVTAADARPGDLVCYDWDGGGDFYGASHIGLLTSEVESGRFSTIEGNSDSVPHGRISTFPRSTSTAPNVVFIRMDQ